MSGVAQETDALVASVTQQAADYSSVVIVVDVKGVAFTHPISHSRVVCLANGTDIPLFFKKFFVLFLGDVVAVLDHLPPHDLRILVMTSEFPCIPACATGSPPSVLASFGERELRQFLRLAADSAGLGSRVQRGLHSAP
jgi:hypothetical protein